jgi:hypothetical protein
MHGCGPPDHVEAERKEAGGGGAKCRDGEDGPEWAAGPQEKECCAACRYRCNPERREIPEAIAEGIHTAGTLPVLAARGQDVGGDDRGGDKCSDYVSTENDAHLGDGSHAATGLRQGM